MRKLPSLHARTPFSLSHHPLPAPSPSLPPSCHPLLLSPPSLLTFSLTLPLSLLPPSILYASARCFVRPIVPFAYVCAVEEDIKDALMAIQVMSKAIDIGPAECIIAATLHFAAA